MASVSSGFYPVGAPYRAQSDRPAPRALVRLSDASGGLRDTMSAVVRGGRSLSRWPVRYRRSGTGRNTNAGIHAHTYALHMHT